MSLSRLRSGTIVTTAVAFLLLACTADLLARQTTGKKYALVVGVKEYEHGDKLGKLNYTENDAVELATVLKAAGYEVVLLTSTDGKTNPDAKPTRANIDKQLKELLAKCKQHDMVLVALSGHGLQFDNVEDSFFCPEDALPQADEKGQKTLLSLKYVYKELNDSKGAVKLLLVDACRNNPSTSRSLGGAGAGQPPKGVAALYSSSAGERAYEHDNYRHGIFFYHVLEGLRGKAKNIDGEVTWDALQAYVRKKVSEDVPKLLDGVNQTPSLNAGELRGEPPVLIGRGVELTVQGRLAIMIGPLDRTTAERMQVEQRSQPQLVIVIPGGGGDAMGLRRGDVLRRINGRDLQTANDAVAMFRTLNRGERVEIEVVRDRQPLKLVGRNETTFGATEEMRRVRELASRDDAAAQNLLGTMYQDGRGTTKDDAEAAKWYRKAADLGFAHAQYNLGVLYIDGHGVRKDETEAARWFVKASDQGYSPAQYRLGLSYVNGLGVAKDDTEAAKWYRKAADQGNALAQNNLGVLYLTGHGVAKDEAEAARWYRKAAEQGNSIAQDNLGVLYASGRGVTKDEAESVMWHRKSAEQGYAPAQTNLGVMYANGRGVARDDAEAVKWYRKAAEQGNVLGQVHLGYMHEYGRGVTKDETEAARWYRKGADQGNAVAQCNLGILYANGRGVARDDAEAVKWYRKSALQGFVNAQASLGFMYEKGRGVKQDDAEAAVWYRKAGEQGNAVAQNNLGYLYQNGRGVAKDESEAAMWYRKSANQGNTYAMNNLGVLYETGRGVAKDESEAYRLYRRAADQGDATGQCNVGLCFEVGRGVNKNLTEAAAWYRKAAAQGHQRAIEALKRINVTL